MSNHNKARRRVQRRALGNLRAWLRERAPGCPADTWPKAVCVAQARKLAYTYDERPPDELWAHAVRGIGMSGITSAFAMRDLLWRMTLLELANILGARR